MAIEVKLPQFGMGMSEAIIVRWLKAEGEPIALDEPLVEIEAAKTTVEVPSPAAGILSRWVVPEGETVPVYAVIALIAEEGEGAPPEGTTAVSAAPEPVVAAAPSAVADGVRAAPNASPRARRLAEQNGIDIAMLAGSGPGGRVTDDDVESAIARASSGEDVAAPLSKVRQRIARRMVASLQDTAQYTLTRRADVTGLLRLRRSIKVRDGAAPSVNDFLIKATALALREHPALNATFGTEGLIRHDRIDLGFAVALDEGLTVAVVRGADRLSVTAIAAETTRLTALVRDGRAPLSDLTGATFTISSLGAFGIDAFTPIINLPEVAILGVGTAAEQACRDEQGALVWRQSIALSLTLDHRVIDGAPGARFLRTLAATLRDPETMLE